MIFFKTKSGDHEQNIPVDYFLHSQQINSTSYVLEDIEKQVNSEKRTMVEQLPEGTNVVKGREIEKGEGYKNSEENLELEEMIGMKTKVSTSTIITLLEDTSPTSSTSTSSEENGNDDGGSSTSGESIPTYTSTRKDFTSEFGLDIVTEPTDSAKMFLPTHTSLSATTTTTSSRQAVGFSDVVEGMMTTMRENVLEEMTKGQHEINGVSDDFSKIEIVEPFLLECQNSEEGTEENDDGKGGNLSTTTAHPHRHGHHNSNYNRYQSNRRRRRWRNNNHNGGVNNGGGNQRFGIDDNDQYSKMYNRNSRKRSTIFCPTTAGKKTGHMDHEEGNQRHFRRGVWKVGNWTLCESKECFTWNTGNICIRHEKSYFNFNYHDSKFTCRLVLVV